MYGTPKDFKLHKTVVYTNIQIPIPRNPEKKDSIRNTNLIIRKWNPKEKSGIAKEDIPVIATIIISMGLTIFALTAAWPNTNAPTIPIVGPIGDGTLKPASLINSKEISITSISNIIGKGTFSLEAKMEKSNSVGISSWWKLVIAI